MTRYNKKNRFWWGYSSEIEMNKAHRKYRRSQEHTKAMRGYKRLAFRMYHKKFRSGKKAFNYFVIVSTCKELNSDEQSNLYKDLRRLRRK